MCGTDVEFFTGEMAYLHTGSRRDTRCGSATSGAARSRRSATGVDRAGSAGASRATPCSAAAVPPLPGGLQHVCEDRFEIGIRGGWPGALAERLAVPVTALHALPDAVDAVAGALVEPGGNALRAVRGADLAR